VTGIDGAAATAFASGGRGARDRIVASAKVLFYRDGIGATGVDQVAGHAHVSKRTLYKHFATKGDLVQAYLRDIDANQAVPRERALMNTGLSPLNRLLALFDAAEDSPARGCPFHNAAVEAAGEMPEVEDIVHAHKLSFVERLIATCAELGVADPRELGHQLAVVFEGAAALSTTLNSTSPMKYARSAAAALIDTASKDADTHIRT